MNDPVVRITTVAIRRGVTVLRVELNRPSRRNAFNAEIIAGIREAMRAAREQPHIRVLVLSGAGKVFCAGADLEWMRAQSAAAEVNKKSAAELAALYSDWRDLHVPTIARVHGAAMGGGAGLVAACDITVASTTTVFAVPEVRLGLLPAVIAPFIIERIGTGRAREWMLSGRRVRAEDAQAAGLVDRVVPEDQLDAAVDAAIADVIRGGPAALGQLKRLLAELPAAAAGGREAINRITAAALEKARASAEARAGISAFLRKKDAPWTGDQQDSRLHRGESSP